MYEFLDYAIIQTFLTYAVLLLYLKTELVNIKLILLQVFFLTLSD